MRFSNCFSWLCSVWPSCGEPDIGHMPTITPSLAVTATDVFTPHFYGVRALADANAVVCSGNGCVRLVRPAVEPTLDQKSTGARRLASRRWPISSVLVIGGSALSSSDPGLGTSRAREVRLPLGAHVRRPLACAVPPFGCWGSLRAGCRTALGRLSPHSTDGRLAATVATSGLKARCQACCPGGKPANPSRCAWRRSTGTWQQTAAPRARSAAARCTWR